MRIGLFGQPCAKALVEKAAAMASAARPRRAKVMMSLPARRRNAALSGRHQSRFRKGRKRVRGAA
jgi:hypothetical protein